MPRARTAPTGSPATGSLISRTRISRRLRWAAACRPSMRRAREAMRWTPRPATSTPWGRSRRRPTAWGSSPTPLRPWAASTFPLISILRAWDPRCASIGWKRAFRVRCRWPPCARSSPSNSTRLRANSRWPARAVTWSGFRSRACRCPGWRARCPASGWKGAVPAGSLSSGPRTGALRCGRRRRSWPPVPRSPGPEGRSPRGLIFPRSCSPTTPPRAGRSSWRRSRSGARGSS